MIEIKDIKDQPERLKINTLHSYYDAGYTKGVTDTKKRYMKAFEDIRAEIRSNAFYENPRIQRVIREPDVLQIIDKHDPSKAGKEQE